jgi:hypothetical protein
MYIMIYHKEFEIGLLKILENKDPSFQGFCPEPLTCGLRFLGKGNVKHGSKINRGLLSLPTKVKDSFRQEVEWADPHRDSMKGPWTQAGTMSDFA